MSTPTEIVFAWLVTYLFHGAALVGTVWLVTRPRFLSLGMKDVLWKLALIGPLLTATFQVMSGHQPPWGISMTGAAATGMAGDSSVAASSPAVSATAVVLTLWAAGAMFGLWRLAAALVRLRTTLRDREDVLDDVAVDGLVELRRRAGIKRRVRLTASEHIGTPLALGRSEICMTPRVIDQLPASQVRSVLAHELAHLERRDPTWLRLSALIESLLFIQPLNFLARREWRANSEFLADAWARRHLGTGEPLARALAEVAAWADGPQPIPLLAAGASGGSLRRRVERLLEPPQTVHESFAPKMAACLGAIGLTALFAPGVVHAEAPTPRATPLAVAAAVVTEDHDELDRKPMSVVVVDDGIVSWGMTWHAGDFEGEVAGERCGHHVWASPQWGSLLGGFDEYDDLAELSRELREMKADFRGRTSKHRRERASERSKRRRLLERLHRL